MSSADDELDEVRALEVIFNMTALPTSGPIRRKEVGAFLGFDSRRNERILKALRGRGYIRFILFGHLELTKLGHMVWLQGSQIAGDTQNGADPVLPSSE